MGASKDKKSSTKDELRNQAENRLRAKKENSQLPVAEKDVRRLVHELEVHQIELEMQNAELRQVQEELELSRNRYLDLYDFAPVGYLTLDAQGRIQGINLTGAKLLGFDRRDLADQPFNRFIADAFGKKAFLKHCQEVLTKPGASSCEVNLKRKDGALFWAELQSILYEPAQSSAGQIFASILDVTAQKEAQARIAHLATFPELSPHPIIETDLQGTVIYANASFRKALKKLSIPDDQNHLFLPPDLPELIGAMRQKNDHRYEVREVEVNGKVFIESIIVPDHLNVARIYAQDITRRKQAEEALKKAHDSLEQTVDKRTRELKMALLDVQAMKEQLEAENIYFRHENKIKYQFEHIIGKSDGLKYVLFRAQQVAPLDTTVLIMGETGTGKELVAAAVHHMSPRQERPLITVNCAALPANLIESELFGREKGAFTGADVRRLGRFEIANGSTLCLDEIGELPLDLQIKLLRVIQSHEFERLGSSNTIKVDVRIIATTNRDLAAEVRQGRFREDLYYRLNVFPITVPPLRQRKEDIPMLAEVFISRYTRKTGKQITSIAKASMQALENYSWPGNIRELESVIERAVILCPGPTLHLSDRLDSASPALTSAARTLQDAERNHILRILSETQWRIEGDSGAAAILGIHASTLRGRMHKLGITRPGTKTPN